MGHSLDAIAFWSDEITLRPHTATDARYLGRPVSLREFAAGRPCSLYRRDDNGELVASVRGGDFIEGPECVA